MELLIAALVFGLYMVVRPSCLFAAFESGNFISNIYYGSAARDDESTKNFISNCSLSGVIAAVGSIIFYYAILLAAISVSVLLASAMAVSCAAVIVTIGLVCYEHCRECNISFGDGRP